MKDIPRFKATAVVNDETQTECKCFEDAQNSVAKMAYDCFHMSTAPRVHVQQSPSAPPLVPVCSSPVVPVLEMVAATPVSQLLQVFLPPQSLPLLPPGTLHMYKNRLQQYAQKRDLSFLVHTCEPEGPPHARHFKSRVSFEEKSYETMEFFPTIKEAEQAAAKVVCKKLGIDQIQEDGGLYKKLLQKLTQKKGIKYPKYKTFGSGSPQRPTFLSIVEIGSSTFRGEEARIKKQAEMNAATVACCALTKYKKLTIAKEC